MMRQYYTSFYAESCRLSLETYNNLKWSSPRIAPQNTTVTEMTLFLQVSNFVSTLTLP